MLTSSHSLFWPPVLGISGFSNSGKTTLIEQLLPTLLQHGWKILVLKKHGHPSALEAEYKDTSRFYRQGADSFLHDSYQILYHFHEEATLEQILTRIPRYYDLILMEGNRHAPIPKLWLSQEIPNDPYILAVLPSGESRFSEALRIIEAWLKEQWESLPLAIAVYQNREKIENEEYPLWEKTLGISYCPTFMLCQQPNPLCTQYASIPLLTKNNLPDPILTAFSYLPNYRWLFLPPGCSLSEIPRAIPGKWYYPIPLETYYLHQFAYGLYFPNFYYYGNEIKRES